MEPAAVLCDVLGTVLASRLLFAARLSLSSGAESGLSGGQKAQNFLASGGRGAAPPEPPAKMCDILVQIGVVCHGGVYARADEKICLSAVSLDALTVELASTHTKNTLTTQTKKARQAIAFS